MPKCPVCEEPFALFSALALHFEEASGRSSADHIMWLNKHISTEKEEAYDLAVRLHGYLAIEGTDLRTWIKKRFVERFFSDRPHPFVLAMQHPTAAVLKGYVLEHQHFLKQWVRSLSWVVAKTDADEVTRLELDNIATEFGGGPSGPSHYELLLRMGESLGLEREAVLSSSPLPDTDHAMKVWQETGATRHWVETMAAMHSLELIANRDVKAVGARLTYFDPGILQSDEITDASKAFLREGYQADVEHSEDALVLIQKYAERLGLVDQVQVTFLRSMDEFDRYLSARLERAMEFDASLSSFVAEGTIR